MASRRPVPVAWERVCVRSKCASLRLVVLDLGLEDGNGLTLLDRVRAADGLASRIDQDLPVIVLSGRAGDADRVRSFARGADDHVCKPFLYAELLARMRAVLRRAEGRRARGVVRVGELTLDPSTRAVRLAGRRIELAAKEFALLQALAEQPTRVYRKQELLRDVWGYLSPGNTRTLDAHAYRLRRKLQPSRAALDRERARRGLQADGGAVSWEEAVLIAFGWCGWALALAALCTLWRRLELVADAEHELRGAVTAIGLAADRERPPPVQLQLDRMTAALADLSEARGAQSPPPAELEPGRLAQVLANVIANAAEHGVGPVEVRACRQGGVARLELVNRSEPGRPGRRGRARARAS